MVHRFIDNGLGGLSSSDSSTPTPIAESTHVDDQLAVADWDEIEWVDEWDDAPWTVEDAKAAQEQFMLELEQEMVEMEEEIR